jgi:SAM-dependent methyltransferase
MRDCPLGCGPLVPDGTPLRDNRMGLPHVVYVGWCTVCGLGVTLDPPPRAELESLYERHYAASQGRIPRTGCLPRAWHLVNGSLPLTDRVRVGPVLDIGSHTGEALVTLRRKGLEVVGLEPNREAAAVARGYGLEVIEAPVEDADLPPGRFASVLLSQVLEHVDDPHTVLRKVRGTLEEEGTVYVIVPNAASVWRGVFGPHWVHWHVPFHLLHFTPPALAKLVGQCGFAVAKWRTVTPGEWLLMSTTAWRNARHGRYELDSISGGYGRRLLVAPAGRVGDLLGRGDAIVAEAVTAAD